MVAYVDHDVQRYTGQAVGLVDSCQPERAGAFLGNPAAAIEAAPVPLVGVGRGHLLDRDPVPPLGAESSL